MSISLSTIILGPLVCAHSPCMCVGCAGVPDDTHASLAVEALERLSKALRCSVVVLPNWIVPLANAVHVQAHHYVR